MNNRKILVISSISPYKSANLGIDVISSLEAAGYEVDFLTQYKISSTNYISVHENTEPEIAVQTIAGKKSVSPIKKFFRKFLSLKNILPKKENQFTIINWNEACPPIEAELIVRKINTPYRFAIVLFWQGMLTADSLKKIHDKIKVPLFILAMDMFPFTGGCFYFWNCRKFIYSSCCKCPGTTTHKQKFFIKNNFIYKQQVYSSIPCVFLGNKWMRAFIEKSPIISGKPVREILLVINENLFKMRERKSLYKDFNIGMEDDKFIIFAGAPNLEEKRKGFEYLVKSLKIFAQALTEENRFKVILMLAGHTPHNIQSYFDIQVYTPGYLDYENLAKAYSLADIYLSTSIEDAGPSMINQSIMTGTPVISFDLGVAQDIVITGETGYRAQMLDAEDFAKGIQSIYSLSPQERLRIKKNCRELAINKFSYAAFADKIKQYDAEFCIHSNTRKG